MRILAYWLPPLAWMGVIVWLSTDQWSGEHTLRLLRAFTPWLGAGGAMAELNAVHLLLRKLGHLTEYAILAALWFRAFTGERRLGAGGSAGSALAIALGWAVLDEALQALTPSRTASALDVGIDGAGALLGLGVARLGWWPSLDAATTALLWIAAGGGAAVLAVNALAGVGSGVLWLSVPGAALVLAARRRRRRA